MSNQSETIDEQADQACNETWTRPSKVIAMHRLKMKKKALQARINGTSLNRSVSSDSIINSIPSTSGYSKRKNPFLRNDENKKPKLDESFSPDYGTSSDNSLFRLLNFSNMQPLASNNTSSFSNSSPLTSFASILNHNEEQITTIKTKTDGEKWIPIDWTLKTKLRFMSPKPFSWNRKLKTIEEASGITGFVRCLDTRTCTSHILDASPNAQFHQCSLYWQHPSLPWVTLYPRTQGRVSATVASMTSTAAIKESLQSAWADSLRSLFQLVRARQCPYFYLCANTFTAVFRAAGMCGYPEMHVMVTPTTRGFRQVLKQEDIEFTMPLKNKRLSGSLDLGYDTSDSASQQTSDTWQTIGSDTMKVEEDEPDEEWLQSMGVNADDIRKINVTQAKIVHRAECEVDNSEQSLIFVEGVEAHAFYNFLINCKSVIATTGPLAGIPPTLLAPVAYHGASLQSLKVRENKISDNNYEYFSLELSGPILPHVIHNLRPMLSKDCNVTATFASIPSTAAFSKVKTQMTDKPSDESKVKAFNDSLAGSLVFGLENLSDCGLNKEILKKFCSASPDHIQHVDSLKFNSETELYTWL